MNIQLRGHHLLCLLGFRGMGYSREFTKNMTEVYERLRQEPETMVQIIRGVDDLCKCYPEDKPNHCDAAGVHDKDDSVLQRLGLKTGDRLSWKELLQLLRESMVPDDIPLLCASCPWQPYGVCEEGIARISRGEGLPVLPEKEHKQVR